MKVIQFAYQHSLNFQWPMYIHIIIMTTGDGSGNYYYFSSGMKGIFWLLQSDKPHNALYTLPHILSHTRHM